MTKEQKQKDPREAYEDFLSEISHQFARSEQEKDFMESIRPEVPEEHIPVNVGERVRQVRDRRGLSLEDVSQRTNIDVSMLTSFKLVGDFRKEIFVCLSWISLFLLFCHGGFPISHFSSKSWAPFQDLIVHKYHFMVGKVKGGENSIKFLAQR